MPSSPSLHPELRDLIARAAGFGAEESANEVDPSGTFRRIYDFCEQDARSVQQSLLQVFGPNGIAPPLPLLEDHVSDWMKSAQSWIFGHGTMTLTEAKSCLRKFLRES